MTPIETLKHEHKIIMLVLEIAGEEENSIRKSGIVDFNKIREIIEFSKNFTDGCHHAKEERYLFPKLCEKGFSRDTGPIAVMLKEHREGRKFVQQITDNMLLSLKGNVHAIADLADSLSRYFVLLESHINKENNILFVMANKALTDEDNIKLSEAFEKIDSEEIGEGEFELFHKIANRLSGK